MTKFWRYVFPAIFWTMIYASIRLVTDTGTNEKFWERPWQITTIELCVGILVGYVFDAYLRRFIRNANSAAPGFDALRILREFGVLTLTSVVLINIVLYGIHYLTNDPVQVDDIAIANVVILLYVLLYYAIMRGNNFLRAYIDQRLQLEKTRNDQLSTELKFLKAQYHPHFLFNALNTIYFQMDDDVPGAKHSIERFSSLLRYQLYDQGQMVPVSRELEYLQAFVDLQKMRSSSRLQLKLQLDESLDQQKVYPLLFLPLVENAFKYVGGEYRIEIEAMTRDEAIYFRVRNSTPREEHPTKPGGIGLENLRRRLELLYPGKHRLEITRTPADFEALMSLEV